MEDLEGGGKRRLVKETSGQQEFFVFYLEKNKNRCKRRVWFCFFVCLARSKSVQESKVGGGSEKGDTADFSKVSKIAKEKDLAAIITCRQRRGGFLKILAKCQVAGQV